MIRIFNKSKNTPFHKILSIVILVSFLLNSVITPQMVYGMTPTSVLNLPIPGSMVALTSGFNPAIIQGITVHPQNPLQFDFIIHPGEQDLEGAAFEEESKRLIKYFLAALTVPEEQLWVNLSPYEENRIITREFGNTEMGRDLLAQDYMLKQLSASLMYPEEDLGREFWARVHKEAQSRYGTTEIPMNTFNKIWIVPERAVVHRNGSSVFVVESKLKVLLEEDYAALEHNALNNMDNTSQDDVVSGVSSEIVREILIPAIEREVNEGATFATLRQIYHSLILATWYKKNLKESFLGKVYVDQGKTKGIETDDKLINQKIYDQYITAFKKGVYNYIREDMDPVTNNTIPRKYFSGGVDYAQLSQDIEETGTDPVSAQFLGARNVRVNLDGVDQNGVTVDTASIIKSAGATKTLAVQNDQAMLSVMTDKVKSGLGINVALTRQSLTASVIRYHKGHSVEETNDFTRALASLAIQAARVAPIVDDSGTPAQEIKAAGIAVSAPLDVTLVWETQDYGLLKLTDVYAETGGGPVNSAKTFANQDVPFGIAAISYPDHLRKTWESSFSDQRLKKYFAEAAAGGTKVNVLNIVDGQPLRMLVGRGEAISDEMISRLLLQLDRMLTEAPDLKWLMLTAGGGIAYDRTHYLYGAMVEKAHDFGVDAFIDFKYSSTEREIRSVLEVERKQPQDILAPNIREFILILEKLRMVEPSAFNRRTMTFEQIESYARTLIEQYNLKGILITRDKEGIIFVPREGPMLVEPAIPVVVKSHTSAGDAASAGFVLALIQGKSYAQAIKEANIFGAATVALPGSQVATKESVRQVKDSAMLASKLFTPDEVGMIRGVWERLTPGPQADAKSLEEEIQGLLERMAAPNEKYYVTVGSWMNFIDVIQEVLDQYDPDRNRMHDDLSNLFDLSLTKLLTNLNGFANQNGAMIIKVSDLGDQNYQFDTVLLDRSTQFVDSASGEHIPIDQVLAYWTKDGRGRIRGESLPMAVLAVDHFSILTAQPTPDGNTRAYYWDAQFDLKKDADGPEIILDHAPVREGTMIVVSSRLSMDERYDWLQRDLYRPRDAALLAVSFDEGVHAISRWIASRLMTKKEDEPLVIAINGAPGSGKTTLKKIIVAALKQRGFEKDKDNVYNHYDSHRYIHYYEELWESMSGAESLDELWGNKFYDHNGIVIVESVTKQVPPEWHGRDNLLLVQMVAGEQNRRDRLANRGSSPELAREKAVYDGQKLDDFAHAVSIINDESIINMLFLGIQKFLYSFDQAALSEDAGETLVRAVRDFYRLYNQAAYNPASLERMYRIALTLARAAGIIDIEDQRRKRLSESGGYDQGYILFREREPGGGAIVEEIKTGRLLRDGTLQPRIENDSVSDELGDWIKADEPLRVAALKNKLKEEFDDIVRELEQVLAGQTDRQKRLTVVLTNFMEAVRALQDIDQSKLHREVTWEDLVQLGYSVNIYPASIPFSPESYMAVVSRNGVALDESKVVYQVYPGLKLIHLTMYYPRFPEKGKTGFTPGSGRALLRHLFNPKQYAGYHVISSASEEARKSFARMGDFHIDRDNPEVVGIDEIVPGPQGITPLTNVGRVKDAFNNFSESVLFSPAFTRLNKTQQQYLLKVLRLANVHLIVPDSAMTAEVSNDPFEQQLLNTYGVTHLDRHALNQALLISGVNVQTIRNIDEHVWGELKRDIESGMSVNDLLKKGYRAKLGIGSGKRMTTALQLLTKKPKQPALPVISIFAQHWGKKSAEKAAAAMMEEYARLVEEKSGQMPKVIWVQEDIGADLKSLGAHLSDGQMTRINETFRRIYEGLKEQHGAPYLSRKVLEGAALTDPRTAFGLSELLGVFISLQETSGSVTREDIIARLEEQGRINELESRIDYDLEFNLTLLKSLEIYPLEFHREIEGMTFETFVNHLWSEYLQVMETVVSLKDEGEEARKLRRWRMELHARSNMLERDLNDFVPFLVSLAEETAKTDPNAVIMFARGIEHERIRQIFQPDKPRPLVGPEMTVDLSRQWKDGRVTRITDDDMDLEFVTQVIENVGSSVGLNWEEIYGRGLKGEGVGVMTGRELRAYIRDVTQRHGYPNGLIIHFSWLMNQRTPEGEFLLSSNWDDFIREFLLDLRISQYRETSKAFYLSVSEQYQSEQFRMAIVQYFISSFTAGMDDQQRRRFIDLALRDAFGNKGDSDLKAAFPSLFDAGLVEHIGSFTAWMEQFERAGYVRPGGPGITAQDISNMAQWMADTTAQLPFLTPIAPRPDAAMLADVPETLTVNQQHLKLVPLTPELLKKYKLNIAQLISFMTKGTPTWMVQRDLEVQAENKTLYDPEMSFAVLGQNGLPVGVTIAYQPHNKSHVYLSSFSVHPDFQGTSVASWLLYKTFRTAYLKNIKTAAWETIPKINGDDYARANGYYKRVGIRPVSVSQDGLYLRMEYVHDLAALLPRIYDHFNEKKQPDYAVLSELPADISFHGRTFRAVHITPVLLDKHQDEFSALLMVMNPQKTLAQMQDRITHLALNRNEYNSHYSMAVLDQDGNPVGMTLANDSTHGDYVYLSTFVIDPKLQGSALASWLLYHTFYNAFSNGQHTVKWETFPREDSDIYGRANAYYLKVGAVPVKDTQHTGFRRVEYVYNLAKGLPRILDEFDRKLADSAMMSVSASRTDQDVKSTARKTWDIMLEVFSAMRHSSEENIAAVMNKYRGMAVFYKELGHNGVYFLEEPVNDPAEFGGRFKRGDKILKFHIDGTERAKMRILLKEVLSAAVTSQLREAGYAGIYFNTTNQSLRQLWLRETKSVVMNAPRGTTVKTYITALYGRVFYGYSISGSPKRVVYAFPVSPVKTTVTEGTAALPTGEELRPIREMLHVSYAGRINPLLDWLKQQNYLPLEALDESAVIDAGSSYGYSTVDIGNLLLALNPRLHVYGVDPALGLERRRQKLSIPDNVTFIQDDHRLQKGQRPANIKLIISTNMLVYYDESTKKKVIKQMSEYLEEGGLMVLGIGGHAERNNSLNFIVLSKQQGQMIPVELVFNLSFYSPDNDEEVFGYWRKYFPDGMGEAFKFRAVDLDQLLKEERNRIRQQLYKLGQTTWERQLPEIFKAQQSLLRTEGIKVVDLPDGSVSIPLEGILSAAGTGVDGALLADRYWVLRQRDESLYKTQLERIQSVSTGFLVEGRDLFEALAYFAQLGEAGLASEKDGPEKDLNSLIGALKNLSLQIRVEIDYHRNTGYSSSHLDFIRTWQALNDFIDVYENNEVLRTNLDRLYRQYVNNDGVLTVDQAMVGKETQAELWEDLPLPIQPERLTKTVRAEIRPDGKLYFNGQLSPDASAATPVHDGSSHMAIAQVQGSYSYVLEWLAVRAMLKSDEYDPSSTKLIRVIEERVTELMEDYIQIYDVEGPEAAEAFYESNRGENIITEFGWKRPQFTDAIKISREARKKWWNDGADSQEPIILEFDLRPETLLWQDQSMMARKPRILVVDDYESIRKATGNLLRSMDYEVVNAVNGVDALKVIGEELHAGRPVDLILTDRSMPEMNGEQLIASLRQDDRFSSIPVIMNTSAEESEILKLSERLRVPVLPKPFDMDTLLDLIKANLPDQAMAASVPTKESVIEVFTAIEWIFSAAVSGEFNEARIEEARKALAELEKTYQNPYLVHLVQDQANYLGANVLSGLISVDQVAGSVRSAIERNKKIVSGLKLLTTSQDLTRYTRSFSSFDFHELANRDDAADEAMLGYWGKDRSAYRKIIEKLNDPARKSLITSALVKQVRTFTDEGYDFDVIVHPLQQYLDHTQRYISLPHLSPEYPPSAQDEMMEEYRQEYERERQRALEGEWVTVPERLEIVKGSRLNDIDGAMLSKIHDEKTKQLLRLMQRASYGIYHTGPMNVKELIDAAEAVNPGFRHPFNEAQLTQFKGEQFERLIRLVNEQIMIPRGLIIHGFKSDGSVSYLTIGQDSWKEEPYMGQLSIWTASVRAAEEHISDAFSLGWFAFIDHQSREKFYRRLYQQLRRGVVTNDPDGITALYGQLFKQLNLSEDEFVRIMIDNVTLEEKIHARDAAYTAGLKGDYRTLFEKAPEILIAQTIARPEFEVLQRGEGDPDRLNWLAVMEFSAKLQGVILEMEEYLQKGREDLAYFLFYDYLRNQMDYLTSHNEHNHNVALYFIDELLERHLVRDDRLLGYLNRDPAVTPARQALALLQEIYNKHFYSEEERLQKLMEKDRIQVRLTGPLADQSMLGENETRIIFDVQNMTADNYRVDNAMLDELLKQPGVMEGIVVAAVGTGIYGAYKIWNRKRHMPKNLLTLEILRMKNIDLMESGTVLEDKRIKNAEENLKSDEINKMVESLREIHTSELSQDQKLKIFASSFNYHKDHLETYTVISESVIGAGWGGYERIDTFEDGKSITFDDHLQAMAILAEIMLHYGAVESYDRLEKIYRKDIIQQYMKANTGQGYDHIPYSYSEETKEYKFLSEYFGRSKRLRKLATRLKVMGVDNAQLSEVGGIDLNPNNLDIETRGEDPPLQIEFDAQKLQNLNIQGFVPVIINITPITNIPLLLGIADEDPAGGQKKITYEDESAPLDRRERFSLQKAGELSRL